MPEPRRERPPDPDLLARVREILQGRRGKDNAIHAADLRRALGISDDGVSFRTRQYITHLIKEEAMPIAATTDGGYFVVATAEEARDYVQSLEGRIIGIRGRVDAFRRAVAAQMPDVEMD